MAKTISRFTMFEHADLTFGTKKSCLNGTRHLQPKEWVVDGTPLAALRQCWAGLSVRPDQ